MDRQKMSRVFKRCDLPKFSIFYFFLEKIFFSEIVFSNLFQCIFVVKITIYVCTNKIVCWSLINYRNEHFFQKFFSSKFFFIKTFTLTIPLFLQSKLPHVLLYVFPKKKK